MAVTDQVRRIKSAKAALKESIENKGVIVGNGTIDTYAAKVDAIEQGITPAGTLNITENDTYDVTTYAEAVVNVPGTQPTGTTTITQNGEYDVSDYATADVQVPGIVPTGTYTITSNGTYNIDEYEYVSVDVPQQGGSLAIQFGTELPQQVPEDGTVFILSDASMQNPRVLQTQSDEYFKLTTKNINYLRSVETYDTKYIGYIYDSNTGENTHYFLLHMLGTGTDEYTIASFKPSDGYVDENAYAFSNISGTGLAVTNHSVACIADGYIYVLVMADTVVNLKIDPTTWTATTIASCPHYNTYAYNNVLNQPIFYNDTLVTFWRDKVYIYDINSNTWAQTVLDSSSDYLYAEGGNFVCINPNHVEPYVIIESSGKLFDFNLDRYILTTLCDLPSQSKVFLGNVASSNSLYIYKQRCNNFNLVDPINHYIYAGIPYNANPKSSNFLIDSPAIQDNATTFYFAVDSYAGSSVTRILKEFRLPYEWMDYSIGGYSQDTSEYIEWPYDLIISNTGVTQYYIKLYDNMYASASSLLYFGNNSAASEENVFENDYTYIAQNGTWILWQDWSALANPPETTIYSSLSGYNADNVGQEYYVKVASMESFCVHHNSTDITMTINGTTLNCLWYSQGIDYPWGPDQDPEYYLELYFSGSRLFTQSSVQASIYFEDEMLIDDSGRVPSKEYTQSVWLEDYTPGPVVSTFNATYDDSRADKFQIDIGWDREIVAGSRYNSSYSPHEVWVYKVENGQPTSQNCEMTAVSLSNGHTIYKRTGTIPAWITDGTEIALSVQFDTVRDSTDQYRKNKYIPTSDMVTVVINDTTPTYTVTFNSNSGSPTYQSQSVRYGNTATNPGSPTRSHYTFSGWTLNGTAYNFSTPVTGDITLTASWTPVNYTVTFNSNGGSSVSSQSVPYNTTATRPTDPTRSHYSFSGWYSDSGLTTAFNFNTPITANKTLYAKWTYVPEPHTPSDHKDFVAYTFDPNTISIKFDTSTRINNGVHQIQASNAKVYLNSNAYFGYDVKVHVYVNGNEICGKNLSSSTTGGGGYGWSFDLDCTGWVNSGANGSQTTVGFSWDFQSTQISKHNTGSGSVNCSYYS